MLIEGFMFVLILIFLALIAIALSVRLCLIENKYERLEKEHRRAEAEIERYKQYFRTRAILKEASDFYKEGKKK